MKRKKLIIILISIIIIISLIVISFLLLNKNQLVLKKDTFIFELGDEVPFTSSYYLNNPKEIKDIDKYKLNIENKDKFSIVDDKLLSKDAELLEVGTYKLSMKYKNKELQFQIKVEDTKKPEFKTVPEKITLEQNSKDVDLTKFFEAEDLSKVEITIDGDYDLSKIGTYELEVIATDQYENKTSKNFTLEIIDLESAKEEGKVSKTIDGTIYKSDAMIEYENAKNNPAPSSSNNNTSTSKQNNNTTNNNKSNQSSNNASQQSSEGYRRDIANTYASQINAYRRQNGKAELPITTEAQNEADMRAKQIITNYSHNASYGFGENIGYGTAGGNFFEAWKNSPTHRATMLREQNTAMAVSVYEKNGTWYAVASFRMNY